MQITAAQLKSIALYATDANVCKYLPMLNDTMAKYNINTPLRMAHFLAQLVHESGSLAYTTELDSGAAYEHRSDLGNAHPGDGPLYKGRGFIQLTGRTNYTLYGQHLSIDLLTHPELVATAYPADVAGWFWDIHSLNALADADAILPITRVINGGTNGLAERTFYLNRAKAALGCESDHQMIG